MSFESEILNKIQGEMAATMRSSIRAVHDGNDSSVAYKTGFGQGVYAGLEKAMKLITSTIEDKARKDNLL